MQRIIMPFFVAVFISFIITPLVRKFAFRIGALDIPKDERRVHKEPMPLIGGIAIYIGVVVSCLMFLSMDKTLISILIGGTIILISGIIDDLKGLSPKKKMLFQLLAGLVLIIGDVKIDFVTNPFTDNNAVIYLKWLSIPITLFWVVGITNTLNLIDGLDGLAAGVAMISSLSLTLVAQKFGYDTVVIMSAIVAGGCLGFLRFNFNPAKIFMGDTGALLLGYMLAVTSVSGMVKSVAAVALAVPVFALGLPIFDTAFAIIRRYINKKPIMQADKEHLHHRLMRYGLNQRQTVLIMYFISMLLGIVAVIIADTDPFTGIAVATIVVIVAFFSAKKAGLFVRKEQ